VEQEEEYLTNTLQKKLSVVGDFFANFHCSSNPCVQLAKEKIDLENRLEAEEEYIVNKLQSQLNNIMSEKAYVQSHLLIPFFWRLSYVSLLL
jgi:coiled-coil domain-containing protein 6